MPHIQVINHVGSSGTITINMSAPVFQEFGQPVSGKKLGQTIYQCKHCSQPISSKGKTSSNLLRHLEAKHESIFKLIKTPAKTDAQSSMKSFAVTIPGAPLQKFKSDHPLQKAIQNDIISYISQNLLPLSTVESSTFKKIYERTEPRCTVPTRKFLSKLLKERYIVGQMDIMANLHLVDAIALTMDMWTNLQMKSFLGVTAHYISEWQLKSVMLSCHRVKGSHTAENIFHEYEELALSYGISDKISNITHDSASNMLKFDRLLLERDTMFTKNSTEETTNDHDTSFEIDFSDEEEEEEFVFVPIPDLGSKIQTNACIDHVLQLIVKDGLKHVEHFGRLLGKTSKLVSHVRHGTKASELLEEFRRLQQRNATRWHSDLKMVRSVLRIPVYKWSELSYEGKLTAYEFSLLKDYVEIMEPFEKATRETEGHKVVTSSLVLPVITELEIKLQRLALKFDSLLVKTLVNSATKRLAPFKSNMFKIAAGLDPRWKLTWSREVDELKSVIKPELQKLSPLSAPQPVVEVGPKPAKRARFEFLDNLESVTHAEPDQYGKQIDDYFNAPLLEETDDEPADPLQYWKENQFTYPDLAKLVCCYLHIPASSAPVERVFSIAGRVFRPDRNRLSDKRFQELMFIGCNTL